MSETPRPADLIVFGGTGDLSMRKLLPALYHADRDGRPAPETRTIAMSRGGLDEVEAAWRWIDPILGERDSRGTPPEPYPAGSAGPASAYELVGRRGRAWHEEVPV
ncbi:hypothetical protein ACLQ2R_38070 [Streptosporangium sp. DT93]|uniref:hypothetical protein n=1 Tax=Streptosporangium sp. DT93 TaxID=3393428 RepID=UPI003CFB10BC